MFELSGLHWIEILSFISLMNPQASLQYYLNIILLEKEIKSDTLNILAYVTCYGRMLPGVAY